MTVEDEVRQDLPDELAHRCVLLLDHPNELLVERLRDADVQRGLRRLTNLVKARH